MQPLRICLCLFLPVRVLQPLARGGRPDVQRPELQAVELEYLGPAGLQGPARPDREDARCTGAQQGVRGRGGATHREGHAPFERDGQRDLQRTRSVRRPERKGLIF